MEARARQAYSVYVETYGCQMNVYDTTAMQGLLAAGGFERAADEETADIATHAALTGHLVLSTLHTNDAAGALTRLIDLGVAPYLLASTVEAVLAQRQKLVAKSQ